MAKELFIYRILNIILFYLGWVFIVTDAANGHIAKGLVIAAGITLFFIVISTKWTKELLLILSVMVIGFCVDSLLAFTQIIHYNASNPLSNFLAPIWIIALYAIFATTLNTSLSWLKYQPILSMLCGAIGGSVSYYVAIQLQAASFLVPETVGVSIIAIVWFILLPLFFSISKLLDKTFGKAD